MIEGELGLGLGLEGQPGSVLVLGSLSPIRVWLSGSGTGGSLPNPLSTPTPIYLHGEALPLLADPSPVSLSQTIV